MDANKPSCASSSLADLAQRLHLHYRRTSRNCISSSVSQERRAAVLICLFEGASGDLRVILTKRSSKLSTYSGEVSFPGGMMDESDQSEVATALREAKEEIGLDPSLVDVVAILETLLLQTGTFVVPVIALLHDRKSCHLTPNTDEVEAMFDAPLEMFLKDENRRESTLKFLGGNTLIDYFDYEEEQGRKHVIFGLTLIILIEVASIVYQRPPAYEELSSRHLKKVGFSNL